MDNTYFFKKYTPHHRGSINSTTMSHHFTVRTTIVKTHKAKLELRGMRREMLLLINPAIVETKTETPQTRKTEPLLSPRIPLLVMNSVCYQGILTPQLISALSFKVRNQSSYPSTDNENVADRHSGVFLRHQNEFNSANCSTVAGTGDHPVS